MGDRFFVTGLPRSRTAWFAVATNTPRSICFHEPTSGLSSFEELESFWHPSLGVAMGISDSSLAIKIGHILEAFQPRTLIIERPLEDCLASFKTYMDDTGFHVDLTRAKAFAERALLNLARWSSNPLVKTVKYDALKDYDTVAECLRWLLPNVEFVDLRFLMTMNIQAERSYALSRAERQHSGWHMTP